jgi:hypothetical protein
MAERKIKIPFPTPNSPPVDAYEVSVSESTEKWSEITLEDGSVLRVKPNIVGAIRIPGQYDADGNPVYALKANQTAIVTSSPPHLRRGGEGNTESKVQ